MQEDIAEKILRFHVRANSDGEEDQKLKLKVRDAVGKEMGDVYNRQRDTLLWEFQK